MDIRTFKDFREAGILWALNRNVFHPRGYAIGFEYDSETGEVSGWFILGDGSEPYVFDEETDNDAFDRFETFLKEQGAGNG